ncbi:flagellar protein FliS [Acidisoma silvae]|nr:flagellar protein FliS [Acidisoma silvae]
MITDTANRYRESLFDSGASIDWLRPGWRALRLYARKAKEAIEAGDRLAKADMLSRADQLLTVMTGILNTDDGSPLGQSLARIYSALRLALLDANIENSLEPLDDFDRALRVLDSEFLRTSQLLVS